MTDDTQRLAKVRLARSDARRARMYNQTLTGEQEAILYLEKELSDARRYGNTERSDRLKMQKKIHKIEDLVIWARQKNATVIGVKNLAAVVEKGLD